MAIIKAFKGLRFNTDKIGRISDVVSPPYDVIDARVEAELVRRNPYNMVRLDLTKSADTEDSPERYRIVRDRLEKWQADGAMVCDDKPCIYIYDIDYRHPSGKALKRRGLVSLVRLAEFSEGIVKPHEQTFREVVGDRFRLLDTCRTQFSQVFSLFSDPEGRVMTALDQGREPSPLYQVKDRDGCVHTIYRVSDADVITAVARMLAPGSLYIADGHHRYTTALMFREMMADRDGKVAGDASCNHMMMYLCPIEDEGLSVFPTHRLVSLPRTSADDLVERMSAVATVSEVKGGSRESLTTEVLSRMEDVVGDDHRFGMYHSGEDRCFMLRVSPEKVTELLADTAAPLRALDVVVFSDIVLAHGLSLDRGACEGKNLISYHSDPDSALDRAVKDSVAADGSPVLFFLRSTPVEQVCRVADADLVMPHKSTYFYPKILTGLVMNRLG